MKLEEPSKPKPVEPTDDQVKPSLDSEPPLPAESDRSVASGDVEYAEEVAEKPAVSSSPENLPKAVEPPPAATEVIEVSADEERNTRESESLESVAVAATDEPVEVENDLESEVETEVLPTAAVIAEPPAEVPESPELSDPAPIETAAAEETESTQAPELESPALTPRVTTDRPTELGGDPEDQTIEAPTVESVEPIKLIEPTEPLPETVLPIEALADLNPGPMKSIKIDQSLLSEQEVAPSISSDIELPPKPALEPELEIESEYELRIDSALEITIDFQEASCERSVTEPETENELDLELEPAQFLLRDFLDEEATIEPPELISLSCQEETDDIILWIREDEEEITLPVQLSAAGGGGQASASQVAKLIKLIGQYVTRATTRARCAQPPALVS